jgi:uncharacterized integral membrane protein
MKAKIIFIMVLILLFTIFVSQNTEVVTVKAYFWQFQMSIIVLISLVGLLGVIFGFIIARLFDRSSPKEQKNSVESKQGEN